MPAYDVAVLGAGPGGYVAALRAAQRGARTCLVESDLVGGCCLNVGCIPTKAMLHASEVFRHMVRASEYGFAAVEPKVDGAAYMGRVTHVVTTLRNGVEKLLAARKVDVIRGRGRLTARDTIAVQAEAGPQEVKANAIILATGSRPARPAFLPWDSGKVLTTDEATRATGLPASILIVGGGVIGCEFATMYSELGIPTTLVEMLDRLVANIDAEAARAITKSLQARGVNVLVGSKITGMKATDGGIAAEIEGGKTAEAACALIATGRVPNTQDIGLEALGVQLDGKVIQVDDRCRTSVEGLYAIGDVAETRQYAHLASRMGVVAADNAAGHPAPDPRTVIPIGI
jgi:dihydrolipoamide dehydrogenase